MTELGWGSDSFQTRWERGPQGQADELDEAFEMLGGHRISWRIGGVWWFSWADIDGGFALCRELRALSASLPIIFLSARDSDFDIVAGLRLGADDYLTKDVSLPHLTARIAALFRRGDLLSAPPAVEDVIERGPLRLDAKRLTAYWHGKRVDLTLTEFWMVHTLAKYPGHVKDRDSLMRDANIVVDDSTITSHIKRIRQKFQALDAKFDRIATVYGMGYRWNPDAE